MTGAPEGFERGALVVCVNTGPLPSDNPRGPVNASGTPLTYDWPVKGTVYTVSASWSVLFHPTLAVRIHELRMPEGWGYDSRRFRPLRKLTVEFFLKTKTDVPVGEDA